MRKLLIVGAGGHGRSVADLRYSSPSGRCGGLVGTFIIVGADGYGDSVADVMLDE